MGERPSIADILHWPEHQRHLHVCSATPERLREVIEVADVQELGVYGSRLREVMEWEVMPLVAKIQVYLAEGNIQEALDLLYSLWQEHGVEHFTQDELLLFLGAVDTILQNMPESGFLSMNDECFNWRDSYDFRCELQSKAARAGHPLFVVMDAADYMYEGEFAEARRVVEPIKDSFPPATLLDLHVRVLQGDLLALPAIYEMALAPEADAAVFYTIFEITAGRQEWDVFEDYAKFAVERGHYHVVLDHLHQGLGSLTEPGVEVEFAMYFMSLACRLLESIVAAGEKSALCLLAYVYDVQGKEQESLRCLESALILGYDDAIIPLGVFYMSKPLELREALIRRVRAATAMTCPEMADQLEARLNAPFASVKAHDPNS